jgi:putative ABC transport system permease protein
VAGYPGLHAVAPSDEAVRLYGIFRVATDMLNIFVAVLIASAVLSMFIALYGSLKERRYDLAVMRTLGATRERVMALLLFEGLLVSFVGAIVGLLLGHALTSMLGFALQQAQQMSVTGLRFHAGELLILGGALAIGTLTALVPAWRAHEADIATTLARG